MERLHARRLELEAQHQRPAVPRPEVHVHGHFDPPRRVGFEERERGAGRRKHVLRRERDVHALLVTYVAACQASKLIREVDADLVCSQLAAMAHAWALQSWRFDRDYDVTGYLQASFDLLFNGLLTGPGKRSASTLFTKNSETRT